MARREIFIIREGGAGGKNDDGGLLHGGVYHTALDEQIVFSQLNYRASAIWILLLAAGI